MKPQPLPVQIGHAHAGSLAYIAHNLRQHDKAEILQATGRSPEDLVRMTLNVPGPRWLVCRGVYPVAAWGAVPLHPTLHSVWLWGTDEWPHVWRHVTRHILGTVWPLLLDNGMRRAECLALDGWPQFDKWLKFLGAKASSEPRHNYGMNGEPFRDYFWDRTDMEQAARRRQT